MSTVTHDEPDVATAGHVLIIDDEPVNLSVLEGLLVPLGYRVETASDGSEALQKVAARAPDVILLDVMMPGIDGFEVCRRLKADTATALIPVVMVTALDAAQHKVRGLDVGADDFLSKPVDEVELVARVRSSVHRSRLQAQLHTTEAVLSTLATAVEVRDDVTGGHVRRLAENADLLSTALALDPTERVALRWAALLHDIGKIGVPDNVLNKPGPLDAEEWAIMRMHPASGEQIIGPLAGMEQVTPIVRHHHERWDGSGYPDGLAGEDIPRLARAFQLLDIFDALTSPRPYKQALDREEAMAIMRAEQGVTLDPDLAEVFLAQVASQCQVAAEGAL